MPASTKASALSAAECAMSQAPIVTALRCSSELFVKVVSTERPRRSKKALCSAAKFGRFWTPGKTLIRMRSTSVLSILFPDRCRATYDAAYGGSRPPVILLLVDEAGFTRSPTNVRTTKKELRRTQCCVAHSRQYRFL